MESATVRFKRVRSEGWSMRHRRVPRVEPVCSEEGSLSPIVASWRTGPHHTHVRHDAMQPYRHHEHNMSCTAAYNIRLYAQITVMCAMTGACLLLSLGTWTTRGETPRGGSMIDMCILCTDGCMHFDNKYSSTLSPVCDLACDA